MACTGLNPDKPICNLYPTKPKTAKFKQTQKYDKIIDRVLNIRRYRDSDKSFDLQLISPIEYEVLLIADEIFESYERNLRISLPEIFKQFAEIMLKSPRM